jgi:hypothetical protein
MQISTTSNLSSCDRRRSTANLSIAQKQMAPITTIIKTPIRAESIAFHLLPRDSLVHHTQKLSRAFQRAKAGDEGGLQIISKSGSRRSREFKTAMRQRIKEIAASRNLSDKEIKPAPKHGVNLEWLLEGEGRIFKSGAPQ